MNVFFYDAFKFDKEYIPSFFKDKNNFFLGKYFKGGYPKPLRRDNTFSLKNIGNEKLFYFFSGDKRPPLSIEEYLLFGFLVNVARNYLGGRYNHKAYWVLLYRTRFSSVDNLKKALQSLKDKGYIIIKKKTKKYKDSYLFCLYSMKMYVHCIDEKGNLILDGRAFPYREEKEEG